MSERVGIVAFALGTPADILANRQIAQAAERDALYYATGIYTQPDIEIEDNSIPVERIEERPGKPSPTLRIARGAVRWALRKGFNHLVLEAAPDHQWRVLRDVRKAVWEVSADINVVLSEVTNNCFRADSWCTGDSTQPRTKSREAFMKRENILKKMPWWLYRIIAK